MVWSREVQAIINYVDAAGIPYRVTDVNTPGVHTETSYHYAQGTGGVGLAVDFGGSVPGVTSKTIAEMSSIWRAFRPVAPQLAELFYQGPDIGIVVKNGVWRPAVPTLGVSTWNAHRNHVHVAVKRGVLLAAPRITPATTTKRVMPMYSPPLALEPIVAELRAPGGGVWLLAASGAVYAFGGAPYLGSPMGHDYFAGRKAARLEPVGDGYRVVAESAETYGPGFG